MPTYQFLESDVQGSLEQIFKEHYLAERPEMASANTIRQYGKSLRKFSEFLGRVATLEDLTNANLGKLGEDLLDGIEVGTVGREIEDSRSALFDRLSNALDFAGGEIVHDDDIPLRQRRNQLLADVGEKQFAVDRSVDRQRSDQPSEGSS